MKHKKLYAKQIWCFRQWANTAYAAFNSIGKCVKIGVLTTSYSLVSLVSNKVTAQADTTTTHARYDTLQEVSVLAARQKLYAQMPRIITVIDKNTIQHAPVHDLQGILETLTTIDVRSRGDNGVQADLSIRGGNFDQVLILLNGINITDPQTGHYNLDVPINIENIDRIEILEGSGSRILGSNAFSGAINIITGGNKQPSLQASVIGGQYGYISGALSGNTSYKNFSVNASGNYSQSDGYTTNTDFSIGNYFLQCQYAQAALGKINFQTSFQNKNYGANSFYSPAFTNQYEYTKTFFNSIHWEKQFSSLLLESNIYWRRHYDRYELIRDSAYGRNLHRTDATGLQLKAVYYSSLGKTSVGITYRNEKIVSTVLGTPLGTPFDAAFTNDINPHPQYTKGDNRNVTDAYLDHTFITGKFSLSAGVLYSYSNDYGSHWNSGADAAFSLNNHLKIYAGLNQSSRLPTFTDIYYKGPGYAGNTDIQPEKALTYETGIKYYKEKISTNLSFYYRQGTDIIDWIKSTPADAWKSSNITCLNASGITAQVQYFPTSQWIKKIQLNGNWQTVTKNTGDYISKYALDYLRYKIGATFDHKIINHLTASWQISYQGREGNYVDYKTGITVNYKPYLLLNGRLMYNRMHYSVFAEATNIGNITYMDINNIPQAGRWIKAGLQIKLGNNE